MTIDPIESNPLAKAFAKAREALERLTMETFNIPGIMLDEEQIDPTQPKTQRKRKPKGIKWRPSGPKSLEEMFPVGSRFGLRFKQGIAPIDANGKVYYVNLIWPNGWMEVNEHCLCIVGAPPGHEECILFKNNYPETIPPIHPGTELYLTVKLQMD